MSFFSILAARLASLVMWLLFVSKRSLSDSIRSFLLARLARVYRFCDGRYSTCNHPKLLCSVPKKFSIQFKQRTWARHSSQTCV